jgi:hypothetical protein
MSNCAKCGHDYKFWGNSRRRFIFLCDPCADQEEVAAERIKAGGLEVLANHFVPDIECRAVAVGTWKDMSSRLSSLGTHLFLGILGLGTTGSQANVGLIAATTSDLLLVKLDETAAGKNFDYTDLNGMSIPPHYMAGHRDRIRAKVKTLSLGTLAADLETKEVSSVLTIYGDANFKIVLPAAWYSGNQAAATEIAAILRSGLHQ